MTDAAVDPAQREAPRPTLALRRHPGSTAVGLAVSVGAIALTTLLIYPLREVTPAVSNGVVYMLAVLLISTYWGLRLGLVTAVGSALAFNFFHIPPTGRFTIADTQN
jgi:two-component system, OmpR family, sensor histidine kinase KdpD